ncbi:uncharacterized protein LOC132553422 [Ylistrum balloti]|uniref:uncharacterized protein LOC132553422 n=1 Tax=Ylistrum balloti TaxID=509963 RepID=UPI002905C554|nr:uncharacterized protein LOC132553422 [Ylistrum balloti]
MTKRSESLKKKEYAIVSPQVRPRRHTAAAVKFPQPSVGVSLPNSTQSSFQNQSPTLSGQCQCCHHVTRKFGEFQTELKQSKCDHALTLRDSLVDQLQQVPLTPKPAPGKPRAGIVPSADALKHRMIELSPGSQVFIHRDQRDAVIAAGRTPGGRDLNGEKMAAKLLHIFFTEEDFAYNNMKGPHEVIVQAVTAFCLARSTKSPEKVRASMFAELASMQE